MVATGIVGSAISSRADVITPSVGGTEIGPLTSPAYTLGGGAVLLDSTTSQFNFGAASTDSGNLISSVYNNDGNNSLGGYTFVYQIQITTGDISTLDLNSGFAGTLGVFNYSGTAENLNKVTYFSAGNINFVWDPTVGPNGDPQTISIVIDTSANTYGGATASLIDSGSETVADLVPVPEPTTLAAGALMLLPFGLGALRSLRKDQIA